MCEPVKATRYRVHFAGTNGKRRFVGTDDEAGRIHYPMQSDAAELFATFEDAENAANDIPLRYIVKRTVPTIKAVSVLLPADCNPRHGTLAQAMMEAH